MPRRLSMETPSAEFAGSVTAAPEPLEFRLLKTVRRGATGSRVLEWATPATGRNEAAFIATAFDGKTTPSNPGLGERPDQITSATGCSVVDDYQGMTEYHLVI